MPKSEHVIAGLIVGGGLIAATAVILSMRAQAQQKDGVTKPPPTETPTPPTAQKLDGQVQVLVFGLTPGAGPQIKVIGTVKSGSPNPTVALALDILDPANNKYTEFKRGSFPETPVGSTRTLDVTMSQADFAITGSTTGTKTVRGRMILRNASGQVEIASSPTQFTLTTPSAPGVPPPAPGATAQCIDLNNLLQGGGCLTLDPQGYAILTTYRQLYFANADKSPRAGFEACAASVISSTKACAAPPPPQPPPTTAPPPAPHQFVVGDYVVILAPSLDAGKTGYIDSIVAGEFHILGISNVFPANLLAIATAPLYRTSNPPVVRGGRVASSGPTSTVIAGRGFSGRGIQRREP